MTKENKVYDVTVYTWPIEVRVSAKNAREAKSKAYARLKKQNTMKHVRKETDVSESYRSNF